jgi:hypothetical protein
MATDRFALGAWGCTFTNYKRTPKVVLNGVLIPYSFGRKKGFVTVTLDASDTYTVAIDRLDRGFKVTRVSELEGVYCDGLVQAIDLALKAVPS